MGYHKSLAGMGWVSLVGSGATPTPIHLATATSMSLEVKEEDVDLRGADLDIIDSFPSQRTISGKLTISDFSNSLLAAVTNGVTITAGRPIGYSHSAAIPTTPFQITVPNGATFVKDLGVINLTDGKPMTAGATATAAGVYAVSALGVYTFHTADAGDTVLINYSATAAADGTTAEVAAALSSAAAPKFGIHVFKTLAGKSWGIYVPAARIPGLSVSFKRDGWSEVSLDWKAVLSATSKILYTYGPE
jgi:hypothetical protein